MSFLQASLQLAEEEARQRAQIARSVQNDIKRLKHRCPKLRASAQAPIVISKEALETLSRPRRCVVPGEVEHALFDVTDYAKWAAAELERGNAACEQQRKAEQQRQQERQQQLEAWRQQAQQASQMTQQAARDQRLQQRRRQRQAAAEVEQCAAQQLMQYLADVKRKQARAAQVHAAHTAHFTSGGCPGKPHDAGLVSTRCIT